MLCENHEMANQNYSIFGKYQTTLIVKQKRSSVLYIIFWLEIFHKTLILTLRPCVRQQTLASLLKIKLFWPHASIKYENGEIIILPTSKTSALLTVEESCQWIISESCGMYAIAHSINNSNVYWRKRSCKRSTYGGGERREGTLLGRNRNNDSSACRMAYKGNMLFVSPAHS